MNNLVLYRFYSYIVVKINKRTGEDKEKMKKLYKDQVLGLIMVVFSLLAGYMTSKIGILTRKRVQLQMIRRALKDEQV